MRRRSSAWSYGNNRTHIRARLNEGVELRDAAMELRVAERSLLSHAAAVLFNRQR